MNLGSTEAETVIECPECNCTTEVEEEIHSQLYWAVLGYVEEVNKYYNYNEDNKGKSLSIEELKEQGGVCWHYDKWYKEMAKEDGFISRSREVNLFTNGRHVYTEISSQKGFCIVSNNELVGCWEL